MNVFTLAAAIMVVVHVVAGLRRPRLALFVSAFLWLLYATYEYHVANGTLCDVNCNIRVDLVFLFPILGLATYWARRSYLGQPGQTTIVGTVLGVVGLLIAALAAEAYGYAVLSSIALLGALTIVALAVRSNLKSRRQ